MKIGDKVHYIPFKGCDLRLIENGIVKEIPEHTTTAVRVVYRCGGNWENYQNYTSALTYLSDLKLGWKESGIVDKEVAYGDESGNQ